MAQGYWCKEKFGDVSEAGPETHANLCKIVKMFCFEMFVNDDEAAPKWDVNVSNSTPHVSHAD